MKNKVNSGWYFGEYNAAADTADLYIYGIIGYEPDATSFMEEMAKVKNKTLNIYINSPGGDVFDGMSIANQIKRHTGRTVAYIDGLAASAASYIAISADSVVMAENAMFMIHKAWTGLYGNADELRKEAELLDQLDKAILSMYIDKSNLSEVELMDMMQNETWFGVEDAIEWGFADSKAEGRKAAACAGLDKFNYKNMPDLVSDMTKSEKEPETVTVRRVEQALRDAGVSKRDAKAMAGAFNARINIDGENNNTLNNDLKALLAKLNGVCNNE